VEHGVTGYIVRNTSEMADAVRMLDRLDPETCRRAARRRFDLARSMDSYLELYRRIAGHEIKLMPSGASCEGPC
jgi:glycosyltransferase involved in cell wall biosynthesis